MSYAATQNRHHTHVPWMTVIAVAVAVAVAAAVLILVNRPVTQTATEQIQVAPAAVVAGAAVVPAPESPALRRQLAEEVAAPVAQTEAFAYPRNHVIGATLDAQSALVLRPGQAVQAAPNDPHPYNHFPSEP
jgi:hypothetical protein